MKIMTVLGTRPEIIRLSRVMAKLDALCQHTVVHTGQNFTATLNELFFTQLGVRPPDHVLGVSCETVGTQIGQILTGIERLLEQERPDKLLILGDTNSGLAAIVAKRMRIPVYHMEAGNRCYDDRVPEEVNRRIIDHCSDVLMPYTERSRANLLREGIAGERIFVTGNPIYEIIRHYDAQIRKSTILTELGLDDRGYLLVTMHRAENVDQPARLEALVTAFDRLQRQYDLPVIISTHPRTQARLRQFGVASTNPHLRFLEPFGFFDFVTLERQARCVLSDSGTVQEECCILQVPSVTIRDVTERPETIECGSSVLSGADPDTVVRCVQAVMQLPTTWPAPPEYLAEHVSDTVARILLGYTPSITRKEQPSTS